MSWLNTPSEILESVRHQIEEQFYGSITGVYRRWRRNALTTKRYVGGNLAAAMAKKKEFEKDDNAEVEVVRAGEGGQYQCVVTMMTSGEWSPWQRFYQED